MNTRIRYKLTSNGVYESVQRFLTRDGVLLKAVYDVETRVCYLSDTEGTFVYNSPYKNVHAAKLLLKKELKAYGVPFTDEVRRKKEA
jgi:hypothetical protein